MNHKQTTHALTLTALGMVCGDIGTSPPYTLKECATTARISVNTVKVLRSVPLLFRSFTPMATRSKTALSAVSGSKQRAHRLFQYLRRHPGAMDGQVTL